MPILTTVGVLQGGLITDAARQKYVDDTNALLLNGSGDFLFGALPDPVIFQGNPFFANSFNIQPIEMHEATFPVWHKVFIDTMFQATANALDIDGNTALPVPFDPTFVFKPLLPKFKADLTLPDFAIGMALPPLTPPQIEFFFDIDPLDIPDILLDLELPLPVPPLPPIPPIPPLPLDFAFAVPIDLQLPPFPDLIIPPIPPVEFDVTLPLPVIGFLICAVIEAIPAILAALIAKVVQDAGAGLLAAVAEGPPGLIAFVAAVVLDAILSCLGIELKNVLTFLAGFLVYVERLIAMLVVVLIGVIFGEGALITIVAKALQLV